MIRPLARRDMLKVFAVSALGSMIPLPWAAASVRSKLRVVFFTDVHTRLEGNAPAAIRQLTQEIAAVNPDIIIGGGDFITEGYESSIATAELRWKKYLELQRLMPREVFPVLGNHDLTAVAPADGSPASRNPRERFCEAFNLSKTYGSRDACGHRFIFLDAISLTDDELLYEGSVDAAQLEWLKEDLSRVAPGTPIILCTHMPLLTSYYQRTVGATATAPRNRIVTNNRTVLEQFAGHNLLLVLQGHLHVDELIQAGGTTFITGGAVCGRWWRGRYHWTQEGFGVLNIVDGKATWEYRSYGFHQRADPV